MLSDARPTRLELGSNANANFMKEDWVAALCEEDTPQIQVLTIKMSDQGDDEEGAISSKQHSILWPFYQHCQPDLHPTGSHVRHRRIPLSYCFSSGQHSVRIPPGRSLGYIMDAYAVADRFPLHGRLSFALLR